MKKLHDDALEIEVENYLVEQVEARGGRAFKFIVAKVRGIPDRICFLPVGVLLLVETKRPKGGRLSTLQKRIHLWFRGIGFTVHTPCSIADVDAMLERIATIEGGRNVRS